MLGSYLSISEQFLLELFYGLLYHLGIDIKFRLFLVHSKTNSTDEK